MQSKKNGTSDDWLWIAESKRRMRRPTEGTQDSRGYDGCVGGVGNNERSVAQSSFPRYSQKRGRFLSFLTCPAFLRTHAIRLLSIIREWQNSLSITKELF